MSNNRVFKTSLSIGLLVLGVAVSSFAAALAKNPPFGGCPAASCDPAPGVCVQYFYVGNELWWKPVPCENTGEIQ